MNSTRTWRSLVKEYLEHRRSFGTQLRSPESILFLFAEHLDRSHYRGPLTKDVQLSWITGQMGKASINRARKLTVLRGFSKYLSLFDDRAEVPEQGMFGSGHRFFECHIYTDEEIAAFFKQQSRAFRGEDPFGVAAYRYAFGLILACGLRASEVLNLLNEDVDLESGMLKIVETKFKKTRLIPIHESVVTALSEYKSLRNRIFPRCRVNSFFVTSKEFPMTYRGMQKRFYDLRQRLGWTEKQRRIHDFRHTFVANRLVAWHRANEDTEKKIATLSVYLGHAKVSSTYWYFHVVPELMECVSKRFEFLVTGSEAL